MSRSQWQAAQPQQKRPKKVKAETSRRPKNTYVFHLPTGSVKLQAFTKSEARAALKRKLGVERLPAGLVSGQLK